MTQSITHGSVARKENDMAYTRKTRDIYETQVDYGYGFETVTIEETYKEAKEMALCYWENERRPVRIVKRREKMNGTAH